MCWDVGEDVGQRRVYEVSVGKYVGAWGEVRKDVGV